MHRILVIDDDFAVRELLRRTLEGAGYHVQVAADGEVGMRLFREDPTDLIIADIIMPGKQGIDTIAELKRDFPHVGIIAISGGGKRIGPYSYLMLAKQWGAEKVFNKPLKRNELLEAVHELLGE